MTYQHLGTELESNFLPLRCDASCPRRHPYLQLFMTQPRRSLDENSAVRNA